MEEDEYEIIPFDPDFDIAGRYRCPGQRSAPSPFSGAMVACHGHRAWTFDANTHAWMGICRTTDAKEDSYGKSTHKRTYKSYILPTPTFSSLSRCVRNGTGEEHSFIATKPCNNTPRISMASFDYAKSIHQCKISLYEASDMDGTPISISIKGTIEPRFELESRLGTCKTTPSSDTIGFRTISRPNPMRPSGFAPIGVKHWENGFCLVLPKASLIGFGSSRICHSLFLSPGAFTANADFQVNLGKCKTTGVKESLDFPVFKFARTIGFATEHLRFITNGGFKCYLSIREVLLKPGKKHRCGNMVLANLGPISFGRIWGGKGYYKMKRTEGRMRGMDIPSSDF